jgi:hypothetical protein
MTEPISISNSTRSSTSEEIPIHIINLNNRSTIDDQYLNLDNINETVEIEKCKLIMLLCILITSIIFILIAWSNKYI